MESSVLLESQDDRKDLGSPKVREILLSSIRKVADALGTGRRESVYQCALKHELKKSIGGMVMLEYPIPIVYENERVGVSYLDIFLHGNFFVEVKSTAKIGGKDLLQTRAYSRDCGLIGFLVNFKQTSAGGVEYFFLDGNGKISF
jgi:GxxExxY protein